jgi:N-acetyltransferase
LKLFFFSGAKKKKKKKTERMSLLQTSIARFAVKTRTLEESPPSRLGSISKLNNRSAVIAPTINALPNSSSDHSSGGGVVQAHSRLTGSINVSSNSSSKGASKRSKRAAAATDKPVVKKKRVVDENDNEENVALHSNFSVGVGKLPFKRLVASPQLPPVQRVDVVLDDDEEDDEDEPDEDEEKPADASDIIDDESGGGGGGGRTTRKFKQFGSRAATTTMPLFQATLDSPTEPHSPIGDSAAVVTAPSSNQRSSTAAWKALLSGSDMITAGDDDADEDSFGAISRRNAQSMPAAAVVSKTKSRRSAASGDMASALDSTASGAAKQTQMYLDFGQKNFTSVTCPDCGLVYAPGHPEDEATHKKAHAKVLNESLSLSKRWRSQATLRELVVRTYSDRDESLLAVRHGARAADKMAAVRRVMDSALGYAHDNNTAGSEARDVLYVLVSAEGDVMGCCVVYPIVEAFAIDADATVSGAVEVSKERYVGGSVRMGVSRIWVRPQHRRRGIACRMLDGARATFDYAGAIDLDEIAFTQPTPDGLALLQSYIGKGRPLLVCK